MQSALSHEAMNADVAPIQRAVNSWSTVVSAAGTAVQAFNSLRSATVAPNRLIMRSADELMGVERATPELLDAMRRH